MLGEIREFLDTSRCFVRLRCICTYYCIELFYRSPSRVVIAVVRTSLEMTGLGRDDKGTSKSGGLPQTKLKKYLLMPFEVNQQFNHGDIGVNATKARESDKSFGAPPAAITRPIRLTSAIPKIPRLRI